LDYTDSSCPKLLLEPQRINRLTYSNDFSNANWSAIASGTGSTAPVLTANYITSPFGTNDAWRFQATVGSTGYSLLQQSVLVGGTHTGSIWVKSNTSSNQEIYFRVSANETPAIVTPNWTRISITETPGDYFTIGLRDTAGQTNISVDISIYAAQLEDGAYPTSIIPTTTAAVTRLAESCYKTGISSLMPSTEGTLFIDADINFDNSNFTILGSTYVSGGTMFTNSVYFYINNNKIDGQIWNTPAFTGWTGLSPSLANGRHKLAISWKANDFAYYIDGNLIASSTAYSAVPTGMNRLDVGDYYGSYGTNNKYNQMLIFKTRLTNAQLAELTTL
jgi:hypothetical protein